MIDVVLFRPEIPPNTGNVIRLVANTGTRLHLVAPLGFSMDDKQLKRAGLDYHEFASVRAHADWVSCLDFFSGKRMFAVTIRARQNLYGQKFHENDVFLFGSETAGLPAEILEKFPEENRLKIPLRPGNRSLNLSNAVAVTVYEAWRQLGFAGQDAPR